MNPLFPKNEHQSSERFQRRRRQRHNEKNLLRLQREYFRLCRVSNSVPLIELDKPYQRGWVRQFQLTERACRRADSAELLQVLKLVDTVQYCWKGTFEHPRRKRGKRHPLPHKLYRPGFYDLLNSEVPEPLLRWFVIPGGLGVHSRIRLREWIGWRWNSRTDVTCPQHFESVILPLMITHQRANLPEVDARIEEITTYLAQDGRWGKLHRLHGWRNYWRKYEGSFKLRKLHNLLDAEDIRHARREFNDDQPPPLLTTSATNVETKEGTTKIVPFDFPELSFSTHLPYAA